MGLLYQRPFSSCGGTLSRKKTTRQFKRHTQKMSDAENPAVDAVEEVDDSDVEEIGKPGGDDQCAKPCCDAAPTGNPTCLPPDQKAIAAQLMKNPGVLAALQDRLSSIVGSPSGYIQSLPKEVKRRIKALKKLQNEII